MASGEAKPGDLPFLTHLGILKKVEHMQVASLVHSRKDGRMAGRPANIKYMALPVFNGLERAHHGTRPEMLAPQPQVGDGM